MTMFSSQQVIWRGYGRIGKLIPPTHGSNCRMFIIDVLCADISNSLGINSLKGVKEASLLQSHIKIVSDLNFAEPKGAGNKTVECFLSWKCFLG